MQVGCTYTSGAARCLLTWRGPPTNLSDLAADKPLQAHGKNLRLEAQDVAVQHVARDDVDRGFCRRDLRDAAAGDPEGLPSSSPIATSSPVPLVHRIGAGVVRDLGNGFVAYSPLGRGFLTGDVKPAYEYHETDMRRHDPRWQDKNYEANVRGLAQLRELAAEKRITVPQLALAWLLAGGDDIVPIPGTRDSRQFEENAGAARVTLSLADLARIRAAFPSGAFGACYAPGHVPVWQ